MRASLQFRVVHVVVLRGMSLPSNTVLAGFDRKGRRFITAAADFAASTEYLIVGFDATVLNGFGKTSRLDPTTTGGHFRGGGRGHHLAGTVAAGLRHEGVNLLVLLLLLLVMLLLLMDVMNLGIVRGEGSRLERGAGGLLVIPADPERVHRFEAGLVGVAVVHQPVYHGTVGEDGTTAALQQHSGAVGFVPHTGTVGDAANLAAR